MKSQITNSGLGWVRLLLAIISSVLLAGCVPLEQLSIERVPGKNDAAPKALGRFDGLQTELAATATNNQTVRLLIVHGMGISEPGYSTNLVDRVTAKLKLNLISATAETNFQSDGFSVLSVSDFSNGASNLCAYELTWSPITTPIKTNQFALDFEASEISSRQIVNNNLKTNLIDLSLSDVVLYVGKFRTNLQQPIITTIRRMERDSKTNDDPIAVITHSLGSYMLVDTLKDMANTNTSATNQLIPGGTDTGVTSDDADTAVNYAYRVKQIYMLANQIPMLDLSDRTSFEPANAGLFGHLQALRKSSRIKHPKGARPELQIVAFSDPNDLLSFKLRKHDLKEETDSEIKAKGFNVSYTVEHWSIADVFAWPTGAHVNWWTDCRVPQFLAFGHKETKAPQQ